MTAATRVLQRGVGTSDESARPWTLGFLAPVVHGYYFGSLLSGVLDTAAANDARVLAVQTLDAGMLVDELAHHPFGRQLAWRHMDALIVAQECVSDEYLRDASQLGKPVIGICRTPAGFAYPTVVPDNHAGVNAAIDHLIEHGHREIAFASRAPADADDELRYQAYRERLIEHGLSPTTPAEVSWHYKGPEGGGAALRDLLRRSSRPTAVVACTDMAAFALIQAAARAGVTVPDDLAIVGFDDVEDAATSDPPLTTVAQSFTRTGSIACQLMLDALAGRPVAPEPHHTPVTFVRRRSCGCQSLTPDAPPVSNGERAATRLLDALAEVARDERELPRSQRDELIAAGERVVPTLTSAALGRDPSVGDALATLAERLAPPAVPIGIPSVLKIADAIRQIGWSLPPRPADPGFVERINGLAYELSSSLLARCLRHLHSRPAEYRHFEDQRRYYQISTELVRQRNREPRSLGWLAGTEVAAGCLALWDGEETGYGDAETLRVVATYRAGAPGSPSDAREGDSIAVAADTPRGSAGLFQPLEFPPASFVDLIDPSGCELMYLLPVCFDGSDRGFLALVGAFPVREETAFERYNHWAVLLTAALDHQRAARSERALLEEVRVSEERYALAAEASNDGLWDWDIPAGTVYYSNRWKGLLGYGESDVPDMARLWLDRVHPDDRTAVDHVLTQSVERRAPGVEMEFRLRAADGSYRWMISHGRSMYDENGHVTRIVGSMTDVTERKRLEERLRHEALYDTLTGLPNRSLFLDRLRHAIEQAKRRPGNWFAVVFLDLNGFKVINDSLGHQIGDEVLVQVGKRLAGQVRSNDTVSRFGGDEFVLLLEDLHELSDLQRIVNRVLYALSTPMIVEDRTLVVSAAAGIAVSLTGYRTASDFVRDADTAMYQAKAVGGGTSVLFDESMHVGAVARLQLESDLRTAIADQQFELDYQPIVTLSGRRPVAVEALIRWNRPGHGLTSPAEFLPTAESTGLTRQLGRWTIREVCRNLGAWREAMPGQALAPISVNLSPRQFWDPELRANLWQAMSDFKIEPSALVLEVTEEVIMQNQEAASGALTRLHDDGFRIYIDDFGTGYSSLAALHRFPIDAFKIDRSFISRMHDDQRCAELVKVMITMGVNLDIPVIAEGVETERDAEALSQMGCGLAQGYLFSRPVPSARVPELLAELTSGVNRASAPA